MTVAHQPRPFIKRTDQTGEQEIERLTAQMVILAAELAAVRTERDQLRAENLRLQELLYVPEDEKWMAN